MNRVEFLNKIYEKCTCLDWRLIAEPQEILSALRKYRTGKKKTPLQDYKITVENGCLFLNGDFIIRIEPLIRPFNVESSKASYYEGLCLRDYEV